MAKGSAASISSWMDTESVPLARKLEEDVQADVCIVGAGIAGLTTAYLFLKEGKSVVVLDMKGIGSGETERTTAHLSNALDDRYARLEELRGQEEARLAAQAHMAAIDLIESIAKEEHIDCDFERLDGHLFPARGQSVDQLQEELQAAMRADVQGVALHEQSALPDFDTGAFLRFPRQGQFHPLKYLQGLVRTIEDNGGRIFTNARAAPPKGERPLTVKTSHGPSVTAEAVVLATNMPIGADAGIYTKVFSYRTYVIATYVPEGSVPHGLFWDMHDPYHYVRLQRTEGSTKGDLLIVGGEDHKTGQAHEPRDRWARLELWTRERFPSMEEVTYRWSGQVQETVDGLALIGRMPLEDRNIYVVTGDSGMGMTHGTIAGILLTDLIMGRQNPWTKLFDPSRTPLKGMQTFAREGVNVAKQYAGGWLGPAEVSSPDDVKPGQGAVVREGIKKIALYRDEHGAVRRLSAVCPHRGCIVQWNDAEHSWDCPCHGSRFSADGNVLCGPTFDALEQMKDV